MSFAKHPGLQPCASTRQTVRLSGKSLRCGHGLAFPYFTGGIKKPTNPKAQWAKPGCQSGRRETRLASGRFLGLDGLRINNIRPDLREEFQPMPRNPVLRSSPLGHGAGSHPGKFRYSRCTAKRVDNFVCIHAAILAN